MESAFLRYLFEFTENPFSQVIDLNAYLALYETFWNESWFKGGLIWKWYLDQQGKLDPNNSDYTPQKKLAEKVIME